LPRSHRISGDRGFAASGSRRRAGGDVGGGAGRKTVGGRHFPLRGSSDVVRGGRQDSLPLHRGGPRRSPGEGRAGGRLCGDRFGEKNMKTESEIRAALAILSDSRRLLDLIPVERESEIRALEWVLDDVEVAP